MYIALRLLRDGAHTTITTRFPRDATRRFSGMSDSADWLHRLRIVGIDLRNPGQVVALADSVAEQGPLDILINNAAQTVRRSPAAYALLAEAEAAALPDGPAPEVLTIGPGSDAGRPAELHAGPGDGRHWSPTPDALAALALTAGSASADRIAARTAIDAGGLVPDLDPVNSWIQRVDEVDPVEMLEVQLCNSTAPFILIGRLRPALAAAAARRKYVVNVSAMEGQFSRGYKGAGPPAHEHGEGGGEHADPDQRRGDARDRRHPGEQRRHRLDHRRASALRRRCASPARASTLRSISSTGRRASTTRSCAARTARISTVLPEGLRAGPLVRGGRAAPGQRPEGT